jgi:hypothetical protein
VAVNLLLAHRWADSEPGCNLCAGYTGTLRPDGTRAPGPEACGWGATVDFNRIRYGLSAVALMEAGDPNGEVWTQEDRACMRLWVKQFTDWWTTTLLGKSARALHNNIGLVYTSSVLAMALYTQDNACVMLIRTDILIYIYYIYRF